MSFLQKLSQGIQKTDSCLCVGLDPNIKRIPDAVKNEHSEQGQQVLHFLKQVIDSTSRTCAAYKPNLAFFEALGPTGLAVFKEIVDYIPSGKIIIADVKRGDIASSAEHYAKAYFEKFDVDAVTINPLMGLEALEPFLQYPGKAVFALVLTSNPGAEDFLCRPFQGRNLMAEYITEKLADYHEKFESHIGLVTGATQPDKLSAVIQNYQEAALLIPGIGAQGGSIESLLPVLKNHEGIPLVNSSRSILYAGQHAEDWTQAVKNKAAETKKALQPITQNFIK
jgi:orotidine-5'-phosphate decarboxylase